LQALDDYQDQLAFPTRRSSDLELRMERIYSGAPCCMRAGGGTRRTDCGGCRGGLPRHSGYFRGWYDSRGDTSVTTGRSITFALLDRKSTRLNSSHVAISYAVFC